MTKGCLKIASQRAGPPQEKRGGRTQRAGKASRDGRCVAETMGAALENKRQKSEEKVSTLQRARHDSCQEQIGKNIQPKAGNLHYYNPPRKHWCPKEHVWRVHVHLSTYCDLSTYYVPGTVDIIVDVFFFSYKTFGKVRRPRSHVFVTWNWASKLGWG